MTLTLAQKQTILKIMKGAVHGYLQSITNAKTPDEREFYQMQLDEAQQLITIFESKSYVIAVEDEEEIEEEEE